MQVSSDRGYSQRKKQQQGAEGNHAPGEKSAKYKTQHSQKVETTRVPMNQWMDKLNVLYPCNGILLNHKKE